MNKSIAAFVVIMLCLLAVIGMVLMGTVSADVGLPILTAAIGAAIGYLFPSPLQ